MYGSNVRLPKDYDLHKSACHPEHEIGGSRPEHDLFRGSSDALDSCIDRSLHAKARSGAEAQEPWS